MPDNQSLILHNCQKFEVTITAEALAQIDDAKNAAELVIKVDSAMSNELAVDAQRQCRTVLKLVEDARKAAKEPILEAGRALDAAAKNAVAIVAKEEMRIAALTGNYQQAQLAAARSAEAAQREELTQMEKAREERLAKATTIEEREQVREDFSRLTQVLVPVVPPVKAEGQTVREEWEFEVENAHLLANAHPQFVKIEPRRQEIREALKNGLKVQGVKAWKVVKSGVRL